MNSNDIINKLADIRKHFDSNLNNKYVKNIFIKVDLHSTIKQEMNIILINEFNYVDTRGGLIDIYNGIKAVSEFNKEVTSKVLKNLNSYISSTFASSSNMSQNDKILSQMAIKNYPMNIKILNELLLSLFDMLVEYDKHNFSKDPAYLSVKEFDKIKPSLEYNNTLL